MGDENIVDGEDQLPEGAEAIIKAVEEKIKAKPVEEKPESKPAAIPDAQVQYQSWREAKKKSMGWNDEQLSGYEQDIRMAQAPLVKDNALLKLRGAHKDFDVLEKAFTAEVDRYEKAGRVIDSALAEELFYMVKGKELSAGRYAPPESQPKRPPLDNDRRAPARIAPAYSGSAASSGPGDDARETAESKMSEEEMAYLGLLDRSASQVGMSITAEDYVKSREDKKKGRREISEHAIRPLDIDIKSANSADRDLANLWNRGAVRR